MKFCSNCGNPVKFGPVPDDDRPRYYCDHCNTVHYENPNMIVGCLPRWQDKVLLCKRSIEPRSGKWTLPAGFLEIGESVEAGAVRETLEEANAEVKIVQLFAVYNLPQWGQVYLMFLADLANLNFSAGKETLEAKLFKKDEVPWDEIAFSAVNFTLQQYFDHRNHPPCATFMGEKTS